MKIGISIFLICFFLCQNTIADTLYLSNGNVVKGVMLSATDKVIKFETQNGVLEVDKSKIVRGEFFGSGEELSGDLIFEFLFDGRVKDSSGNGNQIKTRSIPYVPGMLNDAKGAIESDGNNRYFYILNGSKVSDVEEFTVAMSFWPKDTTKNSFLISQWENTFDRGKAEGRFSLSVKNRDLMFFVVDEDGYYQSLGKKDIINLKEWNTIAIKFKEGEMSLFVNGETVASNTISKTSLRKGEWPIYFLTAKAGDDLKLYNAIGKLDNVKMFDVALTDSELNLLYDSVFQNK